MRMMLITITATFCIAQLQKFTALHYKICIYNEIISEQVASNKIFFVIVVLFTPFEKNTLSHYQHY